MRLVGNCGRYMGPWGVRAEDTLVVGEEAPEALISYPRVLALT
jgi:hypothetical protein